MKPLDLSFNPFPELRTERLVLRRITLNDSMRLFELRSNPEVMKFIDRPRATSIEDGQELAQKIENALDTNTGITWGIAQSSNPELIGTIGFWRIDVSHHRGEIGYMLDSSYHRKGILTEAMKAAMDYAFDSINLHSIEANVNPANEPSKKLLEKNGFKQEAYFTENYLYNGHFLDSVIYSKVKR